MDVAAIAASGMRSAERRLAASAHNVANLTTEDFHPLSVRQVSTAPGSAAVIERADTPRGVDLVREFAEQIRAAHQFRASLRVLGISQTLHGATVDLFA